MPVIGARTVVECLIRLRELDGAALGDDRAVGLPSLSVTVGEMIESLRASPATARRQGRDPARPGGRADRRHLAAPHDLGARARARAPGGSLARRRRRASTSADA